MPSAALGEILRAAGAGEPDAGQLVIRRADPVLPVLPEVPVVPVSPGMPFL